MRLNRTTSYLGALILCVLAQGCDHQDSTWEKMLMGPFYGQPYTNQPSGSVHTALLLRTNLVLNVYWEHGLEHPVLALSQPHGTSKWARVLIPQYEGRATPEGRITTMYLQRIKSTKTGHKVYFSCYWIGGGQEAGVINLKKDYSFSHFALSW